MCSCMEVVNYILWADREVHGIGRTRNEMKQEHCIVAMPGFLTYIYSVFYKNASQVWIWQGPKIPFTRTRGIRNETRHIYKTPDTNKRPKKGGGSGFFSASSLDYIYASEWVSSLSVAGRPCADLITDLAVVTLWPCGQN